MTRQRGFSLIELAIVLVIVTLLVGGLTVPLGAQIQARRIAETQKTLAAASEAVIGYARTHPAIPANSRYLPCPDVDGDGREDRVGGTCASVIGDIASGYLPWVDLGVATQDAWGNRLRYAVVANFADRAKGFSDSNPPPAGTSPPSDPLVFCSSHACAPAAPDVANNLAVVLVSHGPNGWGALNVNSPPGNPNAAPGGVDEQANLDGDRVYVSRAPTAAGTTSGEYDDLPIAIPFYQLASRICPTGCL